MPRTTRTTASTIPSTGTPSVVWLTVVVAILLALLSFLHWIQIGDNGVAPWDFFGAVSSLGWAAGLWALIPMLLTVLLVTAVGAVLAIKTLTQRALSPRIRAWSAGLIVVGYLFSLIYVLQTTSAVTPESLLRSCNESGLDGTLCVTQVQDAMTETPELFAQDAGVALWVSVILGVVFAALLVSQPRISQPRISQRRTSQRSVGPAGRRAKPGRPAKRQR